MQDHGGTEEAEETAENSKSAKNRGFPLSAIYVFFAVQEAREAPGAQSSLR